jgi:phosphonate transport system ATP-binding protein
MLELEAVAMVYLGGARALEPTTLSFVRGGFTVLLGPSGAGKSTLLRSINGLVRPTSGTVTVDGIGDISRRGALRRHRRATGMVFQQHHLIGRLSALDNVMTGRLGYHSGLRTLLPLSRAEKIAGLDALARVGLLAHANRRADQLSGGQQQRVGIARALVQKPALILADEPVASLDPATAERALQLVADICRGDGITAVVSLHQVELARRFADRIVGLAAGRVVFDGPPAAVDAAVLARIYGPASPQSPPPLAEFADRRQTSAEDPRHASPLTAA